MIAIIMLPNLTKLGILIDFRLNQDFIAKNLCVNKDEPILMCSGRCYLSSQLQKAEEQENRQAPLHKKEKLETFHYFFSNISTSHLLPQFTRKVNPLYVNKLFNSSFIMDVFHPPERD